MGFTSPPAWRVIQTSQSHPPLGTFFRNQGTLTLLVHKASLPQLLAHYSQVQPLCGPTWRPFPLDCDYVSLICFVLGVVCSVFGHLVLFWGVDPSLIGWKGGVLNTHRPQTLLCLTWGLGCWGLFHRSYPHLSRRCTTEPLSTWLVALLPMVARCCCWLPARFTVWALRVSPLSCWSPSLRQALCAHVSVAAPSQLLCCNQPLPHIAFYWQGFMSEHRLLPHSSGRRLLLCTVWKKDLRSKGFSCLVPSGSWSPFAHPYYHQWGFS